MLTLKKENKQLLLKYLINKLLKLLYNTKV